MRPVTSACLLTTLWMLVLYLSDLAESDGFRGFGVFKLLPLDSVESFDTCAILPEDGEDADVQHNRVLPSYRKSNSIYDVFRLTEFSEVHEFCQGQLYMTSAFCDSEGYCVATGLAPADTNTADFDLSFRDAKDQLININRFKVELSGETHKKTWDSFQMRMKISSKDAAAVALLTFPCLSDSTDSVKFPVFYRERQYNEFIVFFVTQFHSRVDLGWIALYLRYHLNLGVDFIVLFTYFKANSEYVTNLRELISSDEMFASRVAVLEWGSLKKINTWSRAQSAMINHGNNIFWGSVVSYIDLDEIFYPVIKGGLRRMVNIYDKKFGSWAFHYLSKVSDKLHTSELIQNATSTYNFSETCTVSIPCHGSARHPSSCRAKGIYRSLNMGVFRIHDFRFLDNNRRLWDAKSVKNSTYQPHKWLNEKHAALLHIRSIQTLSGFVPVSAYNNTPY